MKELTKSGLGLDYGTVALSQTREGWLILGASLAKQIATELHNRVVAVEHIGSTSVPGLLAKPILDFAAGAPHEPDPDLVRDRLEGLGWIYRGDGADEGGLVFVLEARPMYRVAHLHVVRHDGQQWRDYLALRDILRREPSARATYASTKRTLLAAFPSDRKAYSAGKRGTVEALLRP